MTIFIQRFYIISPCSSTLSSLLNKVQTYITIQTDKMWLVTLLVHEYIKACIVIPRKSFWDIHRVVGWISNTWEASVWASSCNRLEGALWHFQRLANFHICIGMDGINGCSLKPLIGSRIDKCHCLMKVPSISSYGHSLSRKNPTKFQYCIWIFPFCKGAS